jgi:peptidoglycan/LPS O-acetylase OafA/YrhL
MLQYSNARIQSLDFLRGIAAFAVMFFHFTGESSIHLSDHNPLRIAGVYGHLGVEVFFVLSGFVIPYSMYASSYQPRSIKEFLIKRTVRIEVPFLILIGAEIILIYVSSFTPWRNGVSERLDAYNILLHIGYLNGVMNKPWLIPAFWTLAIEFQFYILMAFLFPLFLQAGFFYRMIIMVIFVALSIIFPQPYLFFSYGSFFLIGIITFQLVVGIVKIPEFFALSASFLCLMHFQQEAISVLIAIMTVTVILFFKCDWKWSSFLGMISYSLYLIHIPFGGRLLMLTQMYVETELSRSLLIVLFLASSIFVAWLFYLLVEKPSVSLSKSIHYKNTI